MKPTSPELTEAKRLFNKLWQKIAVPYRPSVVVSYDPSTGCQKTMLDGKVTDVKYVRGVVKFDTQS